MPRIYRLPRLMGEEVGRLRVTLNRHEAERPPGWQQDQTHRDQSSLKRPGWGGGYGAPSVGFVWLRLHVCLIKNSCLLRVNAYDNDSIGHMDSLLAPRLFQWGGLSGLTLPSIGNKAKEFVRTPPSEKSHLTGQVAQRGFHSAGSH